MLQQLSPSLMREPRPDYRPQPAQATTFLPVRGIHSDPSVVSARFPMPAHSAGRVAYGRIYQDGSCSCGAFKSRGRCRHAQAWEASRGL